MSLRKAKPYEKNNFLLKFAKYVFFSSCSKHEISNFLRDSPSAGEIFMKVAWYFELYMYWNYEVVEPLGKLTLKCEQQYDYGIFPTVITI